MMIFESECYEKAGVPDEYKFMSRGKEETSNGSDDVSG